MPTFAACLKWAPLRAEVDPLTGAVDVDARFTGVSPADEAALEWALRLAEATGGRVVAISAGPAGAEAILRDALAAGADDALLVEIAPETSSLEVARSLASALAGVDVVCCGDYSLDRGSGSVPAFLAAELGAAQALGLIEARLDEAVDGTAGGSAGGFRVIRRLDQGRREVLAVATPAVLSFEGGLELRRAPLPRVLAARTAAVTHRPRPASLARAVPVTEVGRGPYRPRARVLPPPSGDTRQRVLTLTAALIEHDPPQLVELEPEAAAAAILDQLRLWGQLPGQPEGPPPHEDRDDQVDRLPSPEPAEPAGPAGSAPGADAPATDP